MHLVEQVSFLATLPLRQRMTARLSNRLNRQFPIARRRLQNDRPLLSVTFDDAPLSSLERGADILEAANARGTYYIASAMLARNSPFGPMLNEASIVELYARGHEIGLHTHHHRLVSHLTGEAFSAEMRQNIATLARLVPRESLENFAFPYGFSAWALRHVLSQFARSARVVRAELNAGMSDINHLNCLEFGEPRMPWNVLEACLDKAEATNAWLTVMTHDVSPTPSPYGSTPGRLKALLDAAKVRGIEVVSVRRALDICKVPSFAVQIPASASEQEKFNHIA